MNISAKGENMKGDKNEHVLAVRKRLVDAKNS